MYLETLESNVFGKNFNMVGASGQIFIGRSAHNLFNTIPALSGCSTIMFKPKITRLLTDYL